MAESNTGEKIALAVVGVVALVVLTEAMLKKVSIPSLVPSGGASPSGGAPSPSPAPVARSGAQAPSTKTQASYFPWASVTSKGLAPVFDSPSDKQPPVASIEPGTLVQVSATSQNGYAQVMDLIDPNLTLGWMRLGDLTAQPSIGPTLPSTLSV